MWKYIRTYKIYSSTRVVHVYVMTSVLLEYINVRVHMYILCSDWLCGAQITRLIEV